MSGSNRHVPPSKEQHDRNRDRPHRDPRGVRGLAPGRERRDPVRCAGSGRLPDARAGRQGVQVQGRQQPGHVLEPGVRLQAERRHLASSARASGRTDSDGAAADC